MTGNVVVDDVEKETEPLRPSPGWVAGLALLVVVTLVSLPGGRRADVPPSTLTLPEVVVAEDEWTRLDLPGYGSLTDVAITPSGSYLAVGVGPQFWWSEDGSRWEWADHGADPGRVLAVTASAERAVAVGSIGWSVDQTRAAVWTSDDGRAWEEVEMAAPVPSGLDGVVVTDEGWAAWGWVGATGLFHPATGSLLFTSSDGGRWDPVPVPEESARLATVGRSGDQWLAGGIHVGRPAAWTSFDLEEWSRIPTNGLPFGWATTRIDREGGTLVAEVTDPGSGRTRRWAQGPDGQWHTDGDTVGGPTESVDGDVGVGSGRLWLREDDDWVPVDLDGVPSAVAGSVVVGEAALQPTLWHRNAETETAAVVDEAGDGRWVLVDDLGSGVVGGVWPLGDGWLVGMSQQWWLVGDDSVTPMAAPTADPPARVVAVGDEWMTLPSMHWTGDGLTWEQRGEPWERALTPGARGGTVLAATVVEGTVRVVGTDSAWRWTVAESDDGGQTWRASSEPGAAAPIWDVAGIPGGFVATIARQGGTRDVVVSEDGQDWEAVTEGSVILGVNVPAATTPSGGLLLLDTGEEVDPLPGVPTAITRDGDRVLVVAGNRLWVGPGEWEMVPLDPPHGMSASVVHPLAVEGRLLAVAKDRDRVALFEWEP